MTPYAYYNDTDPYCVQWLRNLIAAGLIPAGDVDYRPIQEVQPDDVRHYTQVHLFAGIGGWSCALRLAGWPDDRPIWTGSCPCQPFSVAGKGLGRDDPRHLWPDMFRLLRAARPVVAMGEQVSGKAGYEWFDGVVDDLEGEGYTARAVDIPACSVNAPHRRNRLYWVAYPDGERQNREHSLLRAEDGNGRASEISEVTGSREGSGVAYPKGQSQREPEHAIGAESRERARGDAGGGGAGGGGRTGGLAHPGRLRSPDGRVSRDLAVPPGEVEGDCEQRERVRDSAGDGGTVGGLDHSPVPRLLHPGPEPPRALRNPARRPEPERRGGSSTGAGFWSPHVLIGPDPEGRYRRIEPGLAPLAPRLPITMARLRALGNSIAPPLAAEVIRAWMETAP